MKVRRLLISVCTVVVACTDQITTSPQVADVRFAKGGGGNSGGTTALTPMQLTGKSCNSADALAINDAVSVVAVGNCNARMISPLIWTPAGASVIPDTGTARDVTLDGSIAGELDFKPFYRAGNSQPVFLPMNGRTWGTVTGISANGVVAVGELQWLEAGVTKSEPALWTWNGVTWELGAISGSGYKVSATGDVIAGVSRDGATAWRNSGGAWVAEVLDDGGFPSRAAGINQDGTVIVGRREVPTTDGAETYEQPVAWTYNGSSWSFTVLQGFNIQEGAAYGAATRSDGSVVVVGYAWEDKAGAGQQQWAVAWIKPVGSAQFSAPLRLDPVVKGAFAVAKDVNARGQVVGSAATRTGSAAVMWSLP